MLTQLQIETGDDGERLTNYPGWPGWTFEVAMDWGSGKVIGITAIPPAGARRNVKRPDAKVLERIQRQVERQYCGGVEGFIELTAAALPNPVRSRDTRQRAQATAIIYQMALQQGFWPRPVIAKVFGISFAQVHDDKQQLVDDENDPSSTVDVLIREAREHGFLPPYDPQRDVPVLWPVGDQAERLPEPGPVLTLHWKPQPPVSTDADGRQVVDLVVIGQWSTGEKPPPIEPLRAVAKPDLPQRLLSVIAEMEAKFPGARIRASNSAP